MLHRAALFLVAGLWLMAAPPAGAVTPVLTTTAATLVTDTDALLNGTIDPLGGTFVVRAEYGLDTGYGSLTPLSYNFSGTGVQAYGFHPAALATNTTYHYRFIAQTVDGGQRFVGNDMTFTTLANPPMVGYAEVSTSVYSPTTAMFNAIDVHAGSSSATVYYQYGLTTAYDHEVMASTTLAKDSRLSSGAFVFVSDLQIATTYHYRCKVVNQQGTVYSEDRSFTTAAGPAAVTAAATNVTDLAATLNGTVNTGGLALNIEFEYGLSTSYGQTVFYKRITNTADQSMSMQARSLLPGTTYHYRMKATDVFDNTWVYYGGDQIFTTEAAATPPTVGGIAVSGVGTTSANLTCAPVYSGSSTTTAVFQYGLTGAYGSSAAATGEMAMDISDSSFYGELTGLAPSTTYHARCVLTNGQGTASSADITFTTASPATVTTGAATSVADLSAVLNGVLNSTDTIHQAALSFEFGTGPEDTLPYNATPANLLGGGAFTLPVAYLRPSTTYRYRAKAHYSIFGGEDYYGPYVYFTTAAANTPPSVGTAAASQVTTTTALISVSSINAGSSDAEIFLEYQAQGGSVQTVLGNPATRALGTESPYGFTLSQLVPGTTYTCRCGATNGQGTAYSTYASFTTPVAPTLTTTAATSVADVTAVLNATANANGGASYAVFFEIGTSTDYGLSFTPITGNLLTGQTTGTFAAAASHLLPNTTYHYRVRAQELVVVNGLLQFTSYNYYGADQTFTTGPPATPPTATTQSASALAPTAATLNALFETGSSPATVVFEYGTTTAYGSRYTAPAAFGASTEATTTYALLGLTPNTAYHYRIIVTNGEGSSTGMDMSFTTLSLPTVTTNAATNVSATSTMLNGSYNRQNGNYTVTFDYGLTTAYGHTATPGGVLIGGGGIIIGGGGIGIGGGGIIIGGGSTSQNVTAPAASLLPLTTYHYRLKLSDGYGNNYYGDDASVTTISPVQAWRQQVFNTTQDAGNAADMANPSGDGVPNLLKYALNMDPAKSGVPPQPQLKDYSGAQHLSLTFQRDPTKTDVTYEVQAADSPGGPWTTLASSAGGAVTSGPGFVGETGLTIGIIGQIGLAPPLQPLNVEVKDIVSMQDAPRRFMRLKVTRQ
ncbi:MAG: hypothetical protein WAW39_09865 [Prosthecobacter sp.]|uniref:hypothetical protein n=1 Tax=Prosthecobacter sp. TaxID=1965333 RepID=UPI003BB155A2